MSRIIFTVTDEMKEDLETEAEKRGGTVAGLIRLYIAESLARATGKPVDSYAVKTGGDRRQAKEE